MRQKGYILLEDGTMFEGFSFASEGEEFAEIVFNTGMTGYQEILTDPSYCGQAVVMTYPLIGNYGINKDDEESYKPHVKAFIVRESCDYPSNWRNEMSLKEYLVKNNIIAIEGIDTRELTKIIREKGTMRCLISATNPINPDEKLDMLKNWRLSNPVDIVTHKEIKKYCSEDNKINVALIDYGMKYNIVRSLVSRGCNVTVFPAFSSAQEILSYNPDGIMLSNGPGDPKDCSYCINQLKMLMGKKPVFGICLGHQLMALAAGADTGKLKYGHRGSNHPVKDLNKDRTYITSQNHGYAVLYENIDDDYMEITHKNMNDGTIEGIRYKKINAFSVQFHPEASPGPMDTSYLFDEFITLMKTK